MQWTYRNIHVLFKRVRPEGGRERRRMSRDFMKYLVSLVLFGSRRAPAEDGGWFWSYLKDFPSLGLTATVNFSGARLPEIT